MFIDVVRSMFLFFNWDSLHVRLNSRSEAWIYKQKNYKKMKSYRKSVWKGHTQIKKCLLILDHLDQRSK